MENPPAQLYRSYGSLNISDSARVIAGDNRCTTILIENSTFNLSCNDVCTATRNTHIEERLCMAVSSPSVRNSVSNVSSQTNHVAIGPNEKHRLGWKWNTSWEKPNQDTGYREQVRPPTTSMIRAARSDTGFPIAKDKKLIDVETLTMNSNPRLNTSEKDIAAVHAGGHSLIAEDCASTSSLFGGTSFKGNDDHRRQILSARSQTQTGECASVTFQDDLTQMCTFARDDEQPRVFFLRKNEAGWSNTTCIESHMPRSEIENRLKHGPANRRRKGPRAESLKKERLLRDLGLQGKHVLDHMLEEVNRCDPYGFKWSITTIDDEYPANTRRTGEITAFSVVLTRNQS